MSVPSSALLARGALAVALTLGLSAADAGAATQTLVPVGAPPVAQAQAAAVPQAADDPVAPSAAEPPISAAKLAPALGSTSFVPITPCRILDTRVGAMFGNGGKRNLVVAGTAGFPGQGGRAGGCGIPTAATAIAAVITPVAPKKPGLVRAWPSARAAEPLANVLNYGTASTTGGGTIPITPAVLRGLTVKNYGGPTHLLIDVTGYYVPPMFGMVSPGGSIYAGSTRIVSATNPLAGVYNVKFDANIAYCTPVVTPYNAGPGVYATAYAFANDAATVHTWYISESTHREIPYSFYFYIAIIC